MTSVELILPCLNEAQALGPVLSSVPDEFEILLVDNGSDDGSPEVAKSHGARVVHESRRGYGAAVHTGVEQANAEIICVMDADGSMSGHELNALVASVRGGTKVLALGRRKPAPGAWPLHAKIANAFLAWLLRRKGIPVHDIGAVRAARRTELLALDVRDRAFGYPLEVLLRAQEAGWTIVEHDITYSPRAAGTKSKVTGTVKGTLRAVRDMAAVLR